MRRTTLRRDAAPSNSPGPSSKESAGRPEEEQQQALFQLPAALRTIIVGGTDEDVADDIAHGDQQVPEVVTELMQALFE